VHTIRMTYGPMYLTHICQPQDQDSVVSDPDDGEPALGDPGPRLQQPGSHWTSWMTLNGICWAPSGLIRDRG